MSFLARLTLVVLWALAVYAQETVTVTETSTVTDTVTSCPSAGLRFYPRAEATVAECAPSCYTTVSQCTSTQYLGTSSGIELPTGSSVILSESETLTNVISLPTVSIPSTSIFANTSASYTSIPETSSVVSQPDVSIGSSALAGGTSSELESTVYGYSTSTATLEATSEIVSNLETIPTFAPSVDSSALAPGTTQFPQGEESTTISEVTTEQVSESAPSDTVSISTEGLSTETYVSQQGSSTLSEDTGASTIPEGVSTTTLKSVITSQVTLTESISTVYNASAGVSTSEEVTEAIDTSTSAGGASTETGQSPASTKDVSSGVSVPTAGSTAAGVSTLTNEAEISTTAPCTSTKHTHIYDNTTIIHSTADQSVDSSALAGSFTSASSLASEYTSATSEVIEQTTAPSAETSEGQAGVSTSEYLASTTKTAVGAQTTLPTEFIPIESTTAQTDSEIATPSQPIETPLPSAESTGPQGYDFGPSSNDGWPSASFASTADAATGFTTLLTTSKATEESSTTTGVKEPKYEPPAYEPPSYREPGYVRKRWGF
ncbi:uncharacterized protein FFB20_06607 [Fusarium fujikuroi]|uniref:Uncharacterized protein n=2 Tax=Fusarium fujikuroi TaxID=5127 RepID=S0EBA2_GIBF5|nr:uncharacterized protein FFUJ_13788 [Fusarium fujikuroi IMI 58289]KLO93449.1 uncharacterized protein Y057_9125 [Fusarium fujikuroi]KLP16267.1 uncharacterized protein LW94_14214 [Fusarium fujikuroi]QGI67844.1 hypothetical protein CEK27_011815 [Fusarium fujikuroi]QGI85080.1 hypothetical protein CEK25_011809 [Fusarium fujikuroi]QGI98732.1 hypothetical protein CEK26_011801 [Fusarium fujikuroi]